VDGAYYALGEHGVDGEEHDGTVFDKPESARVSKNIAGFLFS
jgi:hypothetical protein